MESIRSFKSIRSFIRCVLLFFAGYVFCQNWYDIRLSVNLNTANRQELLKLPWVTEKIADAILDYRLRYGGFVTREELLFAFEQAGLDVDYAVLNNNLRLYCVSEKEWLSKVATNWHNLYPYQLQVYTYDTKGILALILLPEGGQVLFGTGAVEDEKVLKQVKKQIKKLVKKPIIDWLILPDLSPLTCGNLDKVLSEFDVRRIYCPDYKQISPQKAPHGVLMVMTILDKYRVRPFVLDKDTKIDFLQDKYVVMIDVIYPRGKVDAETSSFFVLKYGNHYFWFVGNLGKGGYLDIFGKPGVVERLLRLYSPCVFLYNFKSLPRITLDKINPVYVPTSAGVISSDGVLCYIGDPKKSPPKPVSQFRFVGGKKK